RCLLVVIRGPGLECALGKAVGCKGHGGCERGIDCDGPLQAADGFGETLLGEPVLELQGAKIEVVSVQAGLWLLLRSRDLREMQCRLDRTRHTFSNAVLEVEDIAAVAVKAVGPDLRARGRIDELSGDAKAIATAP